MKEIIFHRTHQGPFATVNGGFVAGTLLDAAANGGGSVRIRRPVPIEEPVYLFAEDGWAAIRQCDQTLAETMPTGLTVAETSFVAVDEALDAREPDIDMAIFADCFVCGRGQPAGLGITPRRLDDGRFAAIWHPAGSDLIQTDLVSARYLQSALDCPGGFAALTAAEKLAVTGSMTSRIEFLPKAEQRLIVVGEAGPREGRKLHATTTIYTESDEVVATAETIWVTLDAVAVDTAA